VGEPGSANGGIGNWICGWISHWTLQRRRAGRTDQWVNEPMHTLTKSPARLWGAKEACPQGGAKVGAHRCGQANLLSPRVQASPDSSRQHLALLSHQMGSTPLRLCPGSSSPDLSRTPCLLPGSPHLSTCSLPGEEGRRQQSPVSAVQPKGPGPFQIGKHRKPPAVPTPSWGTFVLLLTGALGSTLHSARANP
jgi:hypothetical protein